MKLDDYDKQEQFTAKVLSSTRITPDESDVEVRDIVLEIDRPDFEYGPGQSIGVLTPGDAGFGSDEHFRLYSVSNVPARTPEHNPIVEIAVRRVSYIDEYNGERYEGRSSNYLCDLQAGDSISITGPYGYAFEVPEDKEANLLLIGSGTGIAPFRAYVKHIYNDVGDWLGKVRLFYGAQTGLEHFYMNDHRDDFTLFYDEETFGAFKALSPRPNWADPIAWDYCLQDRATEIIEMLNDPKTYVFLAGLSNIRDELDKVFAQMYGSAESWRRRRAELVAGGRWNELLY